MANVPQANATTRRNRHMFGLAPPAWSQGMCLNPAVALMKVAPVKNDGSLVRLDLGH